MSGPWLSVVVTSYRHVSVPTQRDPRAAELAARSRGDHAAAPRPAGPAGPGHARARASARTARRGWSRPRSSSGHDDRRPVAGRVPSAHARRGDDREGAQGAPPRPSRWRTATGDGHRPGGRVRLRRASRPPTSTSSRPGSGAAPTARASSSTSRPSPTRSASCSGPTRSPGSPPSAPRTSPPTASSTPRSAWRPELCTERGLTLDEASPRSSRASGSAPMRAAEAGNPIVMKLLVTAMRQAARSVEVAECAVRWRDAGRRRLRRRRPGEGLPADPPPRRLRPRPARELPHHDPRRRVVRAAVDLGGAPVLRRRAARPRRPDRRRHHRPRRRLGRARPAGGVRPRPARPARDVPDLERPHRRRAIDRASTRSTCSAGSATGSPSTPTTG